MMSFGSHWRVETADRWAQEGCRYQRSDIATFHRSNATETQQHWSTSIC